MDQNTLRERIQRWEDLHTEFKAWPINANSCAETLTAFANTDGGQLILGVDKARQLVGVPDADRIMQWVDNIAYQNCEPPLTITQQVVEIAGGQPVVVVSVPKGDLRPYRTNQGDYFVRTASGKRRASRQELLRLFQATETLYYDEMLVARATIDDLDRQRFDRFLQQTYQQSLRDFSIPYETLLQNLGLVRADGATLRPNVAAILFFGIEPQRFLPHAHLMAARLPGTDLAQSPTDVKRIEGTLPEIVADTVRFLRIHLPVAHTIEGFAPEQRPELPDVALREVLVNALAHRDYTITAPVRIFVFDDRVEIRTPGALPNSVTVAAIRLGAAHVMRNPILYTLFSRLGLVTGIGSGIYRTIEAVKAATGREPDLYLQEQEFVVSLPRRSQS